MWAGMGKVSQGGVHVMLERITACDGDGCNEDEQKIGRKRR